MGANSWRHAKDIETEQLQHLLTKLFCNNCQQHGANAPKIIDNTSPFGTPLQPISAAPFSSTIAECVCVLALLPFQLDGPRCPKVPVADFIAHENRFQRLVRENNPRSQVLHHQLQQDVTDRYQKLVAAATTAPPATKQE